MEEVARNKEKPHRVIENAESEININPNLYHNNLIRRIFFPGVSNPKQGNLEKLINGLFVRVDKMYLIYRNPLTPYITEKVRIFLNAEL
jgi:hypothetical protein